MRLFFDCEFIDRGDAGIELLSIGIVREDGATYYAEPAEARLTHMNAFVAEHVVPHLVSQRTHTLDNDLARTHTVKPRRQIADEIAEFAGEDPRWYAYVDHYDWVCLSGLYGSLVDRPVSWPWGSVNLHTLAGLAGVDAEEEMLSEEQLTAPPLAVTVGHDLWVGPPLPAGAHHALAGAIWDRVLWDLIQLRAGDDPELAALVAS